MYLYAIIYAILWIMVSLHRPFLENSFTEPGITYAKAAEDVSLILHPCLTHHCNHEINKNYVSSHINRYQSSQRSQLGIVFMGLINF